MSKKNQEGAFDRYFKGAYDILLSKYKLSTAAEHSTILGNVREIFIKEFLENILPGDVEYKTGQVINLSGELSNQSDIILQKKKSPYLGLGGNHQISIYEFTLAILEIKSKLDKNELEKIYNQKEKLRELAQKNKELGDNPNIFSNSREVDIGGGSCSVEGIPYFVIAYSGIKIETLEENLIDKSSTLEMIINLEEEYAFINSNYIRTLDISNVKITNDGRYVILENRKDILKFLYLFLNQIFMTKESDEAIILKTYLKNSYLFGF